MTQAIECPEARVSLGVYVLGAIDPADRAAGGRPPGDLP